VRVDKTSWCADATSQAPISVSAGIECRKSLEPWKRPGGKHDYAKVSRPTTRRPAFAEPRIAARTWS
jgi:hypothetical protein